MTENENKPTEADSKLIAQIAVNDLALKGENPAGAVYLLEEHLAILRSAEHGETHADFLFCYFIEPKNCDFGFAGLPITGNVYDFKQKFIKQAEVFLELDDAAQNQYIQEVKAGTKPSAASFPWEGPRFAL